MPSGYIRTREEIKQIIEEIGYIFLDEYSKKTKRVIVQTKEGYKWDGCLSDLMNKKGENGIFSFKNKYSLYNIKMWMKKNKPEFTLLEDNEYRGNNKKLIILHNDAKCQEQFKMTWIDIRQGRGCPVCGGRQIGERNTVFYLRPDLAKEWHSDNEIKPTEITLGSHKKIFWICGVCEYGKNKEWFKSCNDRIYYGCPACSGRVVTEKNMLSNNFPELISEWDSNRNKNLSPFDVSYGSNKKVWWVCKKGHKWNASIKSRTKGNGCKKCSDEQKESKIASELKQYILNKYQAKEEYSILKNPETNRPLPFDIYIFGGQNPELNGVYIEVHWLQHYKITWWHKKMADKKGITPEQEFEYRKKLDDIKKKFAKKNGVYIEVNLKKIKNIFEAIEYVENKIRDK
jgi:hypothetical protein